MTPKKAVWSWETEEGREVWGWAEEMERTRWNVEMFIARIKRDLQKDFYEKRKIIFSLNSRTTWS